MKSSSKKYLLSIAANLVFILATVVVFSNQPEGPHFWYMFSAMILFVISGSWLAINLVLLIVIVWELVAVDFVKWIGDSQEHSWWIIRLLGRFYKWVNTDGH